MQPQTLLLVINIVLLLFAIHMVTQNPRLTKVGKIAWIAFIVIAPLIGSISYIVFGHGRPRWLGGTGGRPRGHVDRTDGGGSFFER